MTSTGTTAPGLRKTALLLHTLRAEDRAWMLKQLPSPHRDEVHALLSELAELGVPADKSLLDEVLANPHAVDTRPAVPLAESSAERVARAPARVVAPLLQAEPDVLVARVLRLAAWPWREAVLDLAGPTRRRRLQEYGIDVTNGPRTALDDALVDALAGRLGSSGSESPPTWPARLRAHWSTWRNRP